MSMEELENLPDEELRVMCAELQGWEMSPDGHWYGLGGSDVTPVAIAGFKNGNIAPLPDYPEDLNAMHKAEDSLSGQEWICYSHALHDVQGEPVVEDVAEQQRLVFHLTARQRCIAFIATKQSS